ncbi:putative SP-containing protein [Vairimorpha necatrix]|uniref:SP-containing protein n=1 Tax=Vairimorpha necatrix TaxID=6039 RepID=A0AAX4J997_9MICR
MFLAAIIFILKIAANNEALIFIDNNEEECTIFLGGNLKYKPGYYILSLLENTYSMEPRLEGSIRDPIAVAFPGLPFAFVPFEIDEIFLNNFDATFNNIDEKIKEKFLKSNIFYRLTFQYNKHSTYAIQLLYLKTRDIVNKFWRSETFEIEKGDKSKLLPLNIESSKTFEFYKVKIPESWQEHFHHTNYNNVYVLNYEKSQQKLGESNSPNITQEKGKESSTTSQSEEVLHEKNENAPNENRPIGNSVLLILACFLLCISIFISYLILSKIRRA